MTLSDRILELLKGRSQHKPLLGDDLLAKTGADPDEVNEALDDLHGRGALNRAEITRGDRTFTAIWPTGLVPRNLSWKDERNNGKGMMGAQLAHNLQQDAERSRNPPSPVTTPDPTPDPTPVPTPDATPIKETPMVRIARPAKIVEEATAAPIKTNRPRNTGLNAGRVQTAVMDALRGQGELSVEHIFARLPSDVDTTLGSIGKTLETLAKRGEIIASLKFHNARHRRFYRLGEAECAQAEPLCSELPGNLRTLRKIGADDHIADAGKMVEPINPPFTTAPAAPDAPIAPQADAPTNPENDGGTHFALFDSGTLLITNGDEFIALTAADATRLASYLSNVHDAMAWG